MICGAPSLHDLVHAKGTGLSVSDWDATLAAEFRLDGVKPAIRCSNLVELADSLLVAGRFLTNISSHYTFSLAHNRDHKSTAPKADGCLHCGACLVGKTCPVTGNVFAARVTTPNAAPLPARGQHFHLENLPFTGCPLRHYAASPDTPPTLVPTGRCQNCSCSGSCPYPSFFRQCGPELAGAPLCQGRSCHGTDDEPHANPDSRGEPQLPTPPAGSMPTHAPGCRSCMVSSSLPIVRHLIQMANEVPLRSTWSVGCPTAEDMPLAAATLALGGHLRVGIDDEDPLATPVGPEHEIEACVSDSPPPAAAEQPAGEAPVDRTMQPPPLSGTPEPDDEEVAAPAKVTNLADLVRRIALMAAAMNRPVATPAEARYLLGLEPCNKDRIQCNVARIQANPSAVPQIAPVQNCEWSLSDVTEVYRAPTYLAYCNLLSERERQLAQQGRTIHRACCGDSPFKVPSLLVDALQRAASERACMPLLGLPQLRDAVAAHVREKFDLQPTLHGGNVVIGLGTRSLATLVLSCCNADALLPTPCWMGFIPIISTARRPLVPIHTYFEGCWKVTPEMIDLICASDPPGCRAPRRILVMSNPSSPTGTSYTADELKALAVVLRRNHILVLSDETYALLRYSGEHVSMARRDIYPEGTIVLGSVSKVYGAQGWRIGYAVIPDALAFFLPPLKNAVSSTYGCVPGPLQFAVLPAFAQPLPEPLRAHLHCQRAIMEALALHLVPIFREAGLRLLTPDASYYLYLDFNALAPLLAAKGITTAWALCTRVLEEIGVSLSPSVCFGRPDQDLAVRFSMTAYDGSAALESCARLLRRRSTATADAPQQQQQSVPRPPADGGVTDAAGMLDALTICPPATTGPVPVPVPVPASDPAFRCGGCTTAGAADLTTSGSSSSSSALSETFSAAPAAAPACARAPAEPASSSPLDEAWIQRHCAMVLEAAHLLVRWVAQLPSSRAPTPPRAHGAASCSALCIPGPTPQAQQPHTQPPTAAPDAAAPHGAAEQGP
eukprot:GAFH01000723.1.p1 GENE.GAFH01000723.1~~GAFH01000723.1.p1  ORF type:complete len:1144 (-),score=283.57 GAFH01000723.1:442-3462(-)